MCGRISLYHEIQDIEGRFDVTAGFSYTPRYNIAPRADIVVIPNDRQDTLTKQHWGLLAPWAEDPDSGPRPINARGESLTDNALFKEPFKTRRCLVIADGFYEWKGDRGSKLPYRVHRKENELFAMAGLWNTWENGDGRETVCIITTQANDLIGDIHDRMPVILTPEQEETWLQAPPSAAKSLIRPYPADDLRTYQVSRKVNDPKNDRPEILQEAGSTQQDFSKYT
ncbi:MAG: SOS response-associated peptidase [Halobacteriaceae archaeon]